jgi:SNF2 family DNA or RNA helicase
MGLEYKIKPWEHQLVGIQRAEWQNEFGLFFEQGTGKTSTAINIVRHKYWHNNGVMRTIIFAPPVVLENWKREWAMHAKIPSRQVIVLTGHNEKRVADYKEANRKFGQEVIFITNYQSLLMENFVEALQNEKPGIVIYDESHRCKGWSTKTGKAAAKVSRMSTFRYILTGTPILNSPMDLFQQFLLLDNGATFGSKFFAFRLKYFEDKNKMMPRDKYFPKWEPLPSTEAVLNEKVKPKTMVVKKSECLDLPPFVRQMYFVEMTGEQARLYKEMKKDFITYVGKDACVANLAITKLLRLQQIVSGFVKLEDSPTEKDLQSNRGDVLRELLEELTPDHKVIVWATFHENFKAIREICDELKIGYVELHGQVKSGDRQKNIDAFNDPGGPRVLIGHPGSGGIGVNLVVASYAIFFSRGFSLEHDLQAEARNYRGGSEVHAKVTRIDLVTKDTVDEIILERLAKKQNISDSILKEIAQEMQLGEN